MLTTVRTLDDTRQRRAYELIGETGADGASLIDDLDSDALDDLLGLESRGVKPLKQALVRVHANGEVETGYIEQFAHDLAELEQRDVPGLSGGPISDAALPSNPSNIRGAAYEVRVAVEILDESNAIERIGKEFELPDDRRPELDIVQSDGDLVEAKRGDFTSGVRTKKVEDLEDQIVDSYIEYRDDPSDTITIAFSDLINQIDSDVIDAIESLDAQYGNIEYRHIQDPQ